MSRVFTPAGQTVETRARVRLPVMLLWEMSRCWRYVRCCRSPWLRLFVLRLFQVRMRVLRLGVVWAQPQASREMLFLERSRYSSSGSLGRVVTVLTLLPLRSSLESRRRFDRQVTGMVVRLLSGSPRAFRLFSNPVKAFLSTALRDPVEMTRPESFSPRLWKSLLCSLVMFLTEMSSRVTLFSGGRLDTSLTSLRSCRGPSLPPELAPSHLQHHDNDFSLLTSRHLPESVRYLTAAANLQRSGVVADLRAAPACLCTPRLRAEHQQEQQDDPHHPDVKMSVPDVSRK